MIIPKYCVLGAHKIKICRTKATDSKLDLMNAHGAYLRSASEIWLHTSLKDEDSYTRMVLLHELTHAILQHYGYTDLNEDEDLVDSIAEGFLQIQEYLTD